VKRGERVGLAVGEVERVAQQRPTAVLELLGGVPVAGLAQLVPVLAEAQQPSNAPRFTASFGVTDSDAAESLEQLVQIADSGLTSRRTPAATG
jgi:hypothetical protein